MRNFSDEIFTEDQNTYFLFNNIFSAYRAVYETMRKNTLQPDSIRFACWTTEATDTLGICNIYCFSTVTLVKRKSLKDKL